MKYTIRQITEGEDEVRLQYHSLTPEVKRILNFLNGEQQKLIGWKDKTQMILETSNILYIESVDGKTFAYTKHDFFRLEFPLSSLEQILRSINFFRCSKSMIINIDQVTHLRSLPSNRIDASMCNGEHILISRTYASEFRKRLKGGLPHE